MWDVVLNTLQAVGEIFIIAGIGIVAGKVGILTPQSNKIYSNIIVNILLPAFLIAKTSQTITFEILIQWWPLIVICTINTTVGFAISSLLKKIIQPPKHFERLFICTATYQNINSIPYKIVEVVCGPGGSLSSFSFAKERAEAYISVYISWASVLFWSWLYNYLRSDDTLNEPLNMNINNPPEINLEDNNIKEEDLEKEKLVTITSNMVYYRTLFLHKINNSKPILKRLITPAQISNLLGIFIGVIPPIKGLFYGANPPLQMFVNICNNIGSGSVGGLLLLLGGSLSEDITVLKKVKGMASLIIGVSLVRLVIMPAIGTGLIIFMRSFQLLPDDPIMQFVILLEFSTPPNIFMIAMAQLLGKGEKEMAATMFWSYIFSVIFMTLWISIFIYILS